MIWLFKIDEVFWNNKPKVNEHYMFPNVGKAISDGEGVRLESATCRKAYGSIP